MISLIYGPKGVGKTKKIIDSANEAMNAAKGSIIYITDKSKHSKELNYNIRFVDTTEYKVRGDGCVEGFIKGILASDNDIEKVYIDGLARMAAIDVNDLAPMFSMLEEMGKQDVVDFIVTVSCEQLPQFLKKYDA